jgi:hypothetical protein
MAELNVVHTPSETVPQTATVAGHTTTTPDTRKLFTIEPFMPAVKADIGNEVCACFCGCICA